MDISLRCVVAMEWGKRQRTMVAWTPVTGYYTHRIHV